MEFFLHFTIFNVLFRIMIIFYFISIVQSEYYGIFRCSLEPPESNLRFVRVRDWAPPQNSILFTINLVLALQTCADMWTYIADHREIPSRGNERFLFTWNKENKKRMKKLAFFLRIEIEKSIADEYRFIWSFVTQNGIARCRHYLAEKIHCKKHSDTTWTNTKEKSID